MAIGAEDTRTFRWCRLFLVPLLGLLLQCCGFAHSCRFPSEWHGLWFQKGYSDHINITDDSISSKGHCREVSDTKYLVYSKSENCFRCIGISAKHKNVLQYKETYCTNLHNTLAEVCKEFNGDALLYSMFRLNATPEKCPFSGPYEFTYSRGHGECKSPPSSINSCTDDSRLLLRFQACADVQGSESRVEELICYASWKEGSSKYLVGKLEHRMAKTDEDKFRCFVYESSKDHQAGYNIAQSGDATCDGLITPQEGSRTLKLRRNSHPHEKCQFPDWLTTPRHWSTLDGRESYKFTHENSTLRILNETDDLIKRIHCREANFSNNTSAQFIVHATSGCTNGYMCMRIHKRASHVVEIQNGNLAHQKSEACSVHYFDPHSAVFVTLINSHLEKHDCPLAGIFRMEGTQPQVARLVASDAAEPSCPEHSILTAGCSGIDKLSIQVDCTPQKKYRTFQCKGSWEENGTHYLIASALEPKRQYCIAVTDNGKLLHFAESPKTCVRNVHIGREGFLAFNLTNTGVCNDISGATSNHHIMQTLKFLPITVLLYSVVSCCLHFI